MAELNVNRSASSGSDITLSYSDGSSELNTPREFGRQCSDDMFLYTNDSTIAHNEQRTGWGWPLAASKYSTTDDSTNNGRDVLHSDDSKGKLDCDIILVSRKAEFADLELQTLRKQIVKETKRGNDLSKEVACLKEERDAFKEECEKLKASQKQARNKLSYEGNPWVLLEEVRQELGHEKNLNANLRLQLQKTQDSNSELIFAVQDLEQMLEQSNRAKEEQGQCSDDDEDQRALEKFVKQHGDAKETYMLEQKILDLSSEIEMYRRDKDELEMQMEQLALDYEILKQENHDMSYKLNQSHLRQQLKLQYECPDSYATVHELENQLEKLENELNECSNELSDSFATVKVQEKQAQGFKAELEALRLGKQELESELEKQSKEFSYALDKIKELEGQFQSREKELGNHAQGNRSDLESISRAKLEQEQRAIRAEEALRLTRWKNANMAGRLQDEFKRLSTEMQSTFEANEKVTSKAITEASQLRSMNSHLEDSLQAAREELQLVKEDHETQMSELREQLSLKSKQMDQMLVEIEEKSNELNDQRENQEVSLQHARAELQSVKEDCQAVVSDLRKELNLKSNQMDQMLLEIEEKSDQLDAQKANEEVLLQHAKEELQSVTEDYEAKLSDLHNQLNLKSNQIDQMLMEIEEKSNQLDAQDELCQSLSDELLILRAETDKLTSDTALLAAQLEQWEELKTELEQVKALVKKHDSLVEKTERERDNLECLIDSAKKEAEKSLEELNATRCLKDEKDNALKNLQSELDTIRAQCEELKHSLLEDELEKEKLRKQVFQLKAEVKKKDDTLTNMEKKLKDSNGRVAAAERTKVISKNNKAELPSRGSKEAATLRMKIKLLEGQIKQQQNAMETSANVFVKKEKDLLNKIEELERRLDELNQSSIVEHDDKKVDGDAGEITLPSSPHRLVENGNETLTNADEDNHNSDALFKEMASLREKNSSMEAELKEMQDRYSEISLKFAEVEGEREKLVMKLRNIKNAKKS